MVPETVTDKQRLDIICGISESEVGPLLGAIDLHNVDFGVAKTRWFWHHPLATVTTGIIVSLVIM